MSLRQSYRILWNVLSTYGKEVIVIGIALLINPFLFHRLGEEGYGVIALTGTTSGLLALLDMGMAHSITRYISKHAVRNESDKLNQVMTITFVAYLLVGVVAFAVVFVVGLFCLDWLGVPEAVLPQAKWVLIFTALSLAVRFPCNTFEGVLRGFQRFDLANIAYVTDRLVYALCVVAALCCFGWGLIAVGFCMLVGTIAASLFRLASVFLSFPDLKLHPRWLSLKTFQEMLQFGLLAFLTQLSSFIEKSGGRLLISIVLTSTFLGYFNLIMVVVFLMARLSTAITNVVMPVASKYDMLEDKDRLRSLLCDGSRFVLTVICPVCLWMIVMSQQILVTWIGPEMEEWAPLLALLATVQMLDLACGTGNMVLMGTGRVKLLGWSYFVSSVLALVVLGLLLVATDCGLYSAVYAFGLGVLVRRVPVLIHMCQTLGLTVGNYLTKSLLPVLAASLGTVAVLLGARGWLADSGWLLLIGSALLAAVTHLVLSWFVVLSPAEKVWFGELVAAVTLRVRKRLQGPSE